MRARTLQRALAVLLLGSTACTVAPKPERFAYESEELRLEVLRRVPDEQAMEDRLPFEVRPEQIERARAVIQAHPYGIPRIRALVGMLSAPEPEGFGLRYEWSTTRSASETLELGEGNCLSFASVLVGLGRGLGWPIYFGEARAVKPTLHVEEDLAWRSEHMVVVITARTVRAVVDFSGPVADYRIHVIDDLRAYAHLVNNRTSEEILHAHRSGVDPDWERARARFELAVRIEPTLGAAWNNQGVALVRLGRFGDARDAYMKASDLQFRSDSTSRNLEMLETRSRGAVSVSGTDLQGHASP